MTYHMWLSMRQVWLLPENMFLDLFDIYEYQKNVEKRAFDEVLDVFPSFFLHMKKRCRCT